MIYSYLLYIHNINDNNVSLIKKLDKFLARLKGELRQNIIFNRQILIIWKIWDIKEGQ